MTTNEFKAAVAFARTELTNISHEHLAIFDGYGLSDFATVFVTVAQVASLITWQALQFNGEFDHNELANIAAVGRRKFQIVG